MCRELFNVLFIGRGESVEYSRLGDSNFLGVEELDGNVESIKGLQFDRILKIIELTT